MDMQYIASNATLPRGQVFSTARKGDKWYNQANVGDVLDLTDTVSGNKFARAVVVDKQLGTREQALSEAGLNSAGNRTALNEQLIAAYGFGMPQDIYSIIGLLIINQ